MPSYKCLGKQSPSPLTFIISLNLLAIYIHIERFLYEGLILCMKCK